MGSLFDMEMDPRKLLTRLDRLEASTRVTLDAISAIRDEIENNLGPERSGLTDKQKLNLIINRKKRLNR